MLAVTLALTSSLCGGCADFVGGTQSRRRPLLTVLLVSQTAALAVAAIVVLASGHEAPARTALALGLVAGVCSAAALGCLYRGLAVGTMMLVAPIAALGAVVPVLAGLASGDNPGPLALGGIVLALAGVALATRQRDDDQRDLSEAAQRGTRAGILLGFLSALAFGCFFLALSVASDGDPLWAVLCTRISFVGSIVVCMLALRQPPIVTPRSARPMIAVGMLDVTAAGLYAIATTHGLLSVTSVLASFPPLVVVLLARFLLGERLRVDQLVGVGFTLLAVTMIAAG